MGDSRGDVSLIYALLGPGWASCGAEIGTLATANSPWNNHRLPSQLHSAFVKPDGVQVSRVFNNLGWGNVKIFLYGFKMSFQADLAETLQTIFLFPFMKNPGWCPPNQATVYDGSAANTSAFGKCD
jgi:hypothetical protein